MSWYQWLSGVIEYCVSYTEMGFLLRREFLLHDTATRTVLRSAFLIQNTIYSTEDGWALCAIIQLADGFRMTAVCTNIM